MSDTSQMCPEFYNIFCDFGSWVASQTLLGL